MGGPGFWQRRTKLRNGLLLLMRLCRPVHQLKHLDASFSCPLLSLPTPPRPPHTYVNSGKLLVSSSRSRASCHLPWWTSSLNSGILKSAKGKGMNNNRNRLKRGL